MAMRAWRNSNREHVRRLWRRTAWRRKGFNNYEGVALGGMETALEIQRQAKALRQQLSTWNHEYYVLAYSSVTDAEYDTRLEELKALEAAHPVLHDPNSPTQRVGAAAVAALGRVAHKLPMLSLEKVKAAGGVVQFFSGPHPGVIEPKVDGVSLDVAYVNGRLVQAATRGDGQVGQDVTPSARTIRTLPLVLRKSLTLHVRGEVFLKWSDFEKLNQRLEAQGEELSAHPRTAAAGALGLKHASEAARVPLSFLAYSVTGPVETRTLATHVDVLELLEELGFLTPLALPAPLESCESMFQTGFRLDDVAEVADRIARLEKARRVQDFPTDGLVFKVDDLAVQARLGLGTTFPKWAVAFKFQPDRVKTRLLAVTWTVGKTGKVTPVGAFEPVLLGGSRVARASLCNADEIGRLNVNVGDEVLVEKSNEIIPRIVAVAVKHSPGVVAALTVCPACGVALRRYAGLVDSFCVNRVCSAQVGARLLYAVGKSGLDIDGCGAQAVATCLASGVDTLAALMGERDFAFFKGALRKKMQAGVQKALEAPLWRKLSALCIEGWGRQTCQEVAARWPTFSGLLDAAGDGSQLQDVVGAVRAAAFDAYANAQVADLVRLTEAGFFPEQAAEVEGTLQGQCFCITGALPGVGNRRDAEAEILKRGGLAKSSVTRAVKYLVVGTEAGSKKLDAARRLGTRCLTPDEFFDLLGWRPVVVATDPERDY